MVIIIFVFGTAVSVPLIVDAAQVTRCIAIDAGHGGDDGGVVGVRTGAKESDLNLIMARIIGDYIEGAGYKVVYTRKNKSATLSGKYSKRADMEKRVQIINRASPLLAVSIHMNSYSGSSRRGAQVFFDKNSEESALLANTIQDNLNLRFNQPDLGRTYSALSAEKFLLQEVHAPIAIVECGFLSNPIDEANLLNSDYRYEFGYEVYCAILNFIRR